MTFHEAIEWWARGYNVVPINAVHKKCPAVRWKPLQTRRVTPSELQRWQPLFSNGVGFITGAISTVIVIESDGPEGETLIAAFEELNGPLPITRTILSGSGRGLHRHFQHPGYRVKTQANPHIKLDIKGDGGFCVLPPSLHKSGGRYTVLDDAEPAKLPAGLLDFIERAAQPAGRTQGASKANASARRGGPVVYREPDTPRRRARLSAMLAHISADCSYPRYRDVVWGILSSGWADAKNIAQQWCLTAKRRYDQADFDQTVESFDPLHEARPTLGTINYWAREGGWNG